MGYLIRKIIKDVIYLLICVTLCISCENKSEEQVKYYSIMHYFYDENNHPDSFLEILRENKGNSIRDIECFGKLELIDSTSEVLEFRGVPLLINGTKFKYSKYEFNKDTTTIFETWDHTFPIIRIEKLNRIYISDSEIYDSLTYLDVIRDTNTFTLLNKYTKNFASIPVRFEVTFNPNECVLVEQKLFEFNECKRYSKIVKIKNIDKNLFYGIWLRALWKKNYTSEGLDLLISGNTLSKMY